MLIYYNGGYGILQPWTSLGDPTLELLLEDLKGSQNNKLVKRAIELTSIDAEARKSKIDLTSGIPIRSHLLVELSDSNFLEKMGRYLSEGVALFKIKIGKSPSFEQQQLKALENMFSNECYKLRLDANLNFTHSTLTKFLEPFGDKLLTRIAFIEDPFLGPPDEWVSFREDWDLRIAHDFAPDILRAAADVWVLKPARENCFPLAELASHQMKRIVITSSLDHDLGYLLAVSEFEQIRFIHPLLVDEPGFLSFENVTGMSGNLKRRGALLDYCELGEQGLVAKKFWKVGIGPIYDSSFGAQKS